MSWWGRSNSPGTTGGAQYSRVLVMPGLGTGYFPSLSAFKGAGESIGQLVETRGELVLAVEHLVEGDLLAGVGGHAAHRGHQARFDAPLHLVVRLVLADGVDQVVPFVLVGIRSSGLILDSQTRSGRFRLCVL